MPVPLEVALRGVMRLATVSPALAMMAGCGLLEPYPGGGNPAEAVLKASSKQPIENGDAETALVDPAFDDSVAVTSNEDPGVAVPGEAVVVDLNFVALNRNVVGGGIQFPGSSEIQWTFIDGVEGEAAGRVRFGYVVGRDVCEGLPNLCHELVTRQFAVVKNSEGQDVDSDGTADGEFVVSPPLDVRVILQCATCESRSCIDLFEGGVCRACNQPQTCDDFFARCFDDGQPNADQAALFDVFLGRNGVSWGSERGCVQGRELCNAAEESGECQPDP